MVKVKAEIWTLGKELEGFSTKMQARLDKPDNDKNGEILANSQAQIKE
jgi:hypothetical protein